MKKQLKKDRMNVGIVGCGNISQAYFNGCRMFRILDVVACADIDDESARRKASENGVRAMPVKALLNDPDIDIVVNLTVPKAHAEVSLAALKAGKHVHSEKPLAVNLRDGRAIADLARRNGLRAGCAPDTFLGAGLQTSRKLIDDGWIGRVLAGTAFFMCRGPESWHPNPMFFYDTGAGPMLDMGPYYVTALVHLLGPAKAVSAVAVKGFAERIATCKEHFGRRIPVQVPTHYSGNILFRNGAVVTVGISFDVHRHGHHNIELYGTDGTLLAPDPNTFGGPVRVFRPGNENWQECALSHAYKDNSRGIGVADMAHAIRSGRPHRCDAALAHHALEVMNAFAASSTAGKTVEISTTCAQPAPFPMGMLPGVLD